MSYSVRKVGGDPWVFSDERAVLVLRGRNAGRIVKAADILRAAGDAERLDMFLVGVVAGATYATMETIAKKVAG